MTKSQQLALALVALATFDASASAGLTSAGVGPQTPATQQEEPTLAQVAPTAANNATAPISIAGNPVAGTAVPVGGAAANAPGTNGANGAPAATPAPRVVAPPPPPDPATLPVSVIRPLNKSAADAAAAPGNPAPAVANADGTTDAAPPTRMPHAQGAPTKAPPPTGSANLPVPAARVASGAAVPRPEPPVKAVPETPPAEPVDASSSGVIFYSGSGIAALVLLLSFGAFVRGNRDESA